MPNYEYVCTACGHRFEWRQAITAPPLEECPSCGGSIRRLLSGGGGILVRGRSDPDPGCSLERTGTTCCGRIQRCDAPPCTEE